jgi:hypothetical protein
VHNVRLHNVRCKRKRQYALIRYWTRRVQPKHSNSTLTRNFQVRQNRSRNARTIACNTITITCHTESISTCDSSTVPACVLVSLLSRHTHKRTRTHTQTHTHAHSKGRICAFGLPPKTYKNLAPRMCSGRVTELLHSNKMVTTL